MNPIGHHIRIRLEDNRAILRSPKQQRIVARTVIELGRQYDLLAFSLPDTHIHIESMCSERGAGRFSQRLGASLKQRLSLPVGFVSYPPEPIRNPRHLKNTLRYVLTQHEQHGLNRFSFMEATNMPDLLGLRTIGLYTRDIIRRWLPRIRTEHFLSWAGLEGLKPARSPVEAILEATLAAATLNELSGSSKSVIEARRAFIEVAGDRLKPKDIADRLNIARRTVYNLKQRPVNDTLVRAIQLQLGLSQLRHAIQQERSSRSTFDRR